MPKVVAPRRIYGSQDIAHELGVSKAAISNAIHRDGNGTPPPAFVSRHPDPNGQDRLFWDERGLERWRTWQSEYRTRRGWDTPA